AALIDAYARLRSENLDLPKSMDAKALRGLRVMLDTGRDVVAELRAITPVEDRIVLLRRLDPFDHPGQIRVPLSPAVEQVLDRHPADVRPGLNLLRGTPADLVKQIQALARRHGGILNERGRIEVESTIEQYQRNAAKLQSGDKVELGNFEGQRAE